MSFFSGVSMFAFVLRLYMAWNLLLFSSINVVFVFTEAYSLYNISLEAQTSVGFGPAATNTYRTSEGGTNEIDSFN